MEHEDGRKDHPIFRSGFVAIAGAPNAGKSTLLNRMLGEKISITSRKPQTTRNRILGVLHRDTSQMIFVDTPGVHRPRNPLHVRIVDIALSAWNDADLILLVVDVSRPVPDAEEIIVAKLKEQSRPIILALNKIDLMEKNLLLRHIDQWANACAFRAVVPISAKQGSQVDALLGEMEKVLPEGPALFPEDTLTDVPERFLAAEMIREKAFRFTGEEIPYAVAVTVDSFKEEPSSSLVKIHATLHVERDSQKGILIGRNGSKLKEIGKESRKDIERMLGTRVFLKLFVRVQKNWTKDARALQRFGY